jgi:hypothetical protein
MNALGSKVMDVVAARVAATAGVVDKVETAARSSDG